MGVGHAAPLISASQRFASNSRPNSSSTSCTSSHARLASHVPTFQFQSPPHLTKRSCPVHSRKNQRCPLRALSHRPIHGMHSPCPPHDRHAGCWIPTRPPHPTPRHCRSSDSTAHIRTPSGAGPSTYVTGVPALLVLFFSLICAHCVTVSSREGQGSDVQTDSTDSTDSVGGQPHRVSRQGALGLRAYCVRTTWAPWAQVWPKHTLYTHEELDLLRASKWPQHTMCLCHHLFRRDPPLPTTHDTDLYREQSASNRALVLPVVKDLGPSSVRPIRSCGRTQPPRADASGPLHAS